MFRRTTQFRSLVCSKLLRNAAGTGQLGEKEAPSDETSRIIKEQVEEQLDKEVKAMSRVASYPHRALTRPVLRITEEQIKSTLFTTQLQDLIQIASNLNCVSFSGPKVHWDGSVLLVKGSPDEKEFDVWVNPEVPGYDDSNSIAPIYGMWENCISCGVCHAWVLRPQQITCKGWDQHGSEKVEVLEGLRARCLMHELDHLQGKTILQQALGSEFVVSGTAMAQRDLWPVNFPSAEAYMTAPHLFFDYVRNTTVIPKGMEWWHASQNMQHFDDERLSK